MAYYTSPSIQLSDSGIGRSTVMQFQRGTITYAAACEQFREFHAMYDSWGVVNDPDQCKRYLDEWEGRLFMACDLLEGRYGASSGDLAQLIVTTGMTPPDAISALFRMRSEELGDDWRFRADAQYPDRIRRDEGAISGPLPGKIPSHWVMWHGADGDWAGIECFIGYADDYNYWQRNGYREVKIEKGAK